MTNLGNDWDLLLKEETEQPYMEELRAFLREEYRHYNIYPPKGDMFRALKLTPYADVKAGSLPRRGAGHGNELFRAGRRAHSALAAKHL